MTPPVAADDVRIALAAEEDFLKRHQKDLARARAVMASLGGKRAALLRDSGFGPMLTAPRTPKALGGLWPLRVLKGLPHGFRAVYTVFRVPAVGLVVQVEWVGDHKEYDALFGYSTS